MNRTGRALTMGCLLLLQPLLALAEGGNSLLIPATGRCTLNVQPEDLANALKACEQTATAGDAQAQFELGEYYYTQTPKNLGKALNWFEKASLQGHAEAQYRLGAMFFRGEGVKANNVQAYLTARGIPASATTTRAFGETMNRVPTADGVRNDQNRRVEITYGPGSGN